MAVKATASRPSQLSEEYVQDSDEENDQDGQDVGSESRDESDNVTEDVSADDSKQNREAPSPDEEGDDALESPEGSEGSSSSEEEDNASQSDESSASGGNKKRTREPGNTAETSQSKRQKTTKPSATTRIPSKPFKPPPGFEPLVLDASDYASDTLQLLSNATGKQVWYISAPASVNISKIERFDIAAVLNGQPICTENQISYRMQPAAEANDILLIPQGIYGSYKHSKTKISRGFQLIAVENDRTEAKVDAPSARLISQSSREVQFTAQNPGQPRAPRQQPVGLKTQYVPFGVARKNSTQDKSPVPPMTNGLDSSELPSTNINRTPSKSRKAVSIVVNDHMDRDEESLTRTSSVATPRKAAEGSPAISSVSGIPGEKKKKKKRPKLVDAPGL